MSALQIIVGAAFQPATVEVMAEAFDTAWEVIAPNLRDHPEQAEAARLAIAKAIISVATKIRRDAEASGHS